MTTPTAQLGVFDFGAIVPITIYYQNELWADAWLALTNTRLRSK